MRVASDFTFFTRARKGRKPVYYCRLRDDDGRRLSAQSTGQTSIAAAQHWVVEQLKNGGFSKPSPTFREYTEKWWLWDECTYVAGKRARGRRIARTYVKTQRGFLEQHILPVFGSRRLARITTRDVERWILDLARTPSRLGTMLSPTSCNHILAGLKIIFREAVRLGDVRVDPTATVLPLVEDRKRKNVLTREEVRKLFAPETLVEVWGDHRHYTINLVAAATACRMGEIQGLRRCSVGQGFLRIEHAWVRVYGLSEPKHGARRPVPIDPYIQGCLQTVLDESPHRDPEDLVFCGVDARHPIDATAILQTFYTALARIGISAAQRRERNLVFHGWRVWLNTFLRAENVPDSKVQQITGHKTPEMTTWYTRFNLADFKDVLDLQASMFAEPAKVSPGGASTAVQPGAKLPTVGSLQEGAGNP